MFFLYLIALLFSVLTLYFSYIDYKRNRFSKKLFVFITVVEIIVIIISMIMMIVTI